VSARARILAPAKVNLSLRVLRRRGDGFHDIDTLFQAVDVTDEVEVEVVGSSLGRGGLELELAGPDLGASEENLAYRAARLFLDEVGSSRGARIRLAKRIPVGAGLGGGSSDAAAVLRCLAEVVGGVPPERLSQLGARLGSDVPFFLGGSPLARGTGRGEVLQPLPSLPAADLVLVSPPVHVSTAEAYGALAASRGSRVPTSDAAAPGLDAWEDLPGVAANDFEAVMVAAHAEIGRALDALRGAGARAALMTGSGSTCFGLFESRAAASHAAEAIGQRTGWRSVAVRTLERFPDVVMPGTGEA